VKLQYITWHMGWFLDCWVGPCSK